MNLGLQRGDLVFGLQKHRQVLEPFCRIVDREQYTQAMKAGKEQMLAQLKARYAHFNLDDVHAAMSWWACFNEGSELLAASDPADLITSDLYGKSAGMKVKNIDKAKKKKRKQAKAAKRKNRR